MTEYREYSGSIESDTPPLLKDILGVELKVGDTVAWGTSYRGGGLGVGTVALAGWKLQKYAKYRLGTNPTTGLPEYERDAKGRPITDPAERMVPDIKVTAMSGIGRKSPNIQWPQKLLVVPDTKVPVT